MAPTLEEARAGYRRMWNDMQVRPEKVAAADAVARKIIANKARYQAIEAQTGVPWYFQGALHNRESSLNFNTYLGNGQPLNRRTTIVPIGRGPFSSFEEGALDGLRMMGLDKIKDWPLERVLYEIERFNGWGYLGKTNSPYVWAGSNHYRSGKYIRDHVYDASAVDQQLGGAVILARLAAMDASVAAALALPAGTPVHSPRPPTPAPVPIPKPKGKTPEIIGTGAVVIGGTVAGKVASDSGASTSQLVMVGGLVLAIVVAVVLIIRKARS